MWEKIELIVQSAPIWIQAASQLLMILTLLATMVVRFIKGDKDDKALAKWKKIFLKVLHWLPTIGINPQTKKLEEALKDLEK